MGANQLNNLRIPVRDLVHDMAPVTPHCAEIQQTKRPSFCACANTESDHGCQLMLFCFCSPNAKFKESNRSQVTVRKCVTTLPISFFLCGAVFASLMHRSRTSQVQ